MLVFLSLSFSRPWHPKLIWGKLLSAGRYFEKKFWVLKLSPAEKQNLKKDYTKTVECVCACWFAVSFGHLTLAEEMLRAQKHLVSWQCDVVVFSFGRRAGLMWVWPAVCVRGVVTLVAGASKPLSGALHHVIRKPNPPLTCTHCWWKSAPCPFGCSKGGRPLWYALGWVGWCLQEGFFSQRFLFTLKINIICLVFVESDVN